VGCMKDDIVETRKTAKLALRHGIADHGRHPARPLRIDCLSSHISLGSPPRVARFTITSLSISCYGVCSFLNKYSKLFNNKSRASGNGRLKHHSS